MVRCTVPKLAEATVVTFGTQSAGLIGLAAGATPDTEMYLVQTTNGGGSYDSHYVTNAVMPVLNGTTAQHVYVFTVASQEGVTPAASRTVTMTFTDDAVTATIRDTGAKEETAEELTEVLLECR